MKYVITYALNGVESSPFVRDTEEQARGKVVELIDAIAEPESYPKIDDPLVEQAMERPLQLGQAMISVYALLEVPELRRLQAVANAAQAYFNDFDNKLVPGHAVISDLRAALREMEGR